MMPCFVTGFLSWDADVCHVDLEKELLHLAAQKPDGEESKNGKKTIHLNQIIRRLMKLFFIFRGTIDSVCF